MTDLLRWIADDSTPGTGRDLRWASLTLSLAALIAAGYVVIAVNRYFQSKLGRSGESRTALSRLCTILASGCGLGLAFFALGPGWGTWRLYDAALLALAAYTWWSVFRMRGIGLVDARLAQLDELERSADKYRQMAEFLPDIVWTATADGSIDFCNQRWAEYTGGGEGAAPTWIDAVHPDERPDLLTWWSTVVTERSPATREVRLKGAAGYRTFVVRAAPIIRGDAVRWLGACSDVEDQKRLVTEKETLAKRKTFFLNALSHDLRAPLNIMALNAHLLKTSAREQADVESAKLIIDHATAAGTLLSKALELAKADAEDHNVIEPVAAADVLRDIGRRFAPVAEQKGLSLRINASAEAQLFTDRQKLERVISNLVDNAIKFTERGSVTVDLSSGGEDVIVAVSDTGPGIPPQNAPRLFDEFYQGRDAGGSGGGFGMGLAICRFLARQIGGEVRLARTDASGSRFELAIRDARRGAESRGLADAASSA